MRVDPSARGVRAAIWPTPSTWPWTMWPPSRSERRTGRSRFTRSPAARAPRQVRCSVSSTASAAHQPSPPSTPPKSMTVRQQPLTAMEAPRTASSRTAAASISRRAPVALGLTARTVPSSSTRPVNIYSVSRFDPLPVEAGVAAELPHTGQPPPPGLGQRAGAGPGEQRKAPGTEHDTAGGDDETGGKAGPQPGAVEGRASFHHDLDDPAPAEHVEDHAHVDTAGRRREFLHLDTGLRPRPTRLGVRGGGREHQRRSDPEVEEGAGGGDAPGGVENDPQRLGGSQPGLEVEIPVGE